MTISPASSDHGSKSYTKHRRSLPRVLRALRHRNYRLFFIGQLISLIGTWMHSVAQGWLVLRLSNSASMLGLTAAASAAPAFLFSLPSGVLAEYISKRRLLLISQAIAMSVAFVIAILTLLGTVSVWQIVACAAVVGIANTLEAPARQAFTLEITGNEDLSNAIALNSLLFHSARFIGPTIAGFMVAAVGEGWVFLLNGLSFVAVIYCLLAMQSSAHRRLARHDISLRAFGTRAISQLLSYLPTAPRIKLLLLHSAIMSFFGFAYLPLMPLIVRDLLSADARGLGVLLGVSGCGSVVAAITLAYVRAGFPRELVLRWSGVFFPLLLVLLSQQSSVTAALPISFFMGWTGVMTMVLANTVIQSEVDDQYRARVMSLFTLSVLGLGPFGGLLLGSIVSYGLSVQVVLGSVGVLTALLVYRTTRHLKNSPKEI